MKIVSGAVILSLRHMIVNLFTLKFQIFKSINILTCVIVYINHRFTFYYQRR